MINIYNGDTHMVSIYHNFMSIDECEDMLAYSWQNLKPSAVTSNDGEGQMHPGRTSSNTWLPHDASDVILGVATRISEAVRMPLKNAEPFQIVHYGEGQQYDYHWDSFDESDEAYNENYMKTGGQRIITALGYLRDVPKGGDTGFNRLGFSVQPKAGTVVVWYNVEPDTTKREILSQHAGLPVIEGEKYAFNLWFRENEFGETNE
jgi:prolyl 4-hydroxylase|tara:strand:+ start:25 stop:639 length:615 start_codon:yes stop_codon:yes gene_type:complete